MRDARAPTQGLVTWELLKGKPTRVPRGELQPLGRIACEKKRNQWGESESWLDECSDSRKSVKARDFIIASIQRLFCYNTTNSVPLPHVPPCPHL